jgi:hypothetical protein
LPGTQLDRLGGDILLEVGDALRAEDRGAISSPFE